MLWICIKSIKLMLGAVTVVKVSLLIVMKAIE